MLVDSIFSMYCLRSSYKEKQVRVLKEKLLCCAYKRVSNVTLFAINGRFLDKWDMSLLIIILV